MIEALLITVGVQAELYQKLFDETMPKYMEFFQKLLQENNNTGFFVGSTVKLEQCSP